VRELERRLLNTALVLQRGTDLAEHRIFIHATSIQIRVLATDTVTNCEKWNSLIQGMSQKQADA
jgi:hypothetical protein